MLFSCIRFVARGWVQQFYVEPGFHFGWPGFEWLTPWPAWGLHLHMALLCLSALCVMLGLFYRLSALVFFLSFTCLELFDQTHYLNHYYLVSLIALLCCMLPLHRVASLDALRGREGGFGASVPYATVFLLRAQLAITYFYAGVAKLGDDWLQRAQPLTTWLQVHADVPVLGPLLTAPGTAHVMAWAGAVFDLSIGALLWWPRSRRFAYLAVIGFHVSTGLLFPIGVFPLVMIALTAVFFEPDWPRRLLRRFAASASAAVQAPQPRRNLGALPTALLAGYLALQVLMPLRHLLYPGEVNWTEEGFRFAWRVMLIEKTGHVQLRVRDPKSGQSWHVSPSEHLTRMQRQMMSTQPDMIASYARAIARQYRAQGYREVEVYADAWASLNGRPAQRLIDPEANLAQPDRPFAHRSYVLPLKR